MAPLISFIPGLGRRESAVLGDCLVCAAAVRERDDRMRVHGRYVHTACAGYRVRRIARSREVGARNRRGDFTGD